MKGKRVLVTGGAGFIGTHLVEALQKKGASVIVLDNDPTGAKKVPKGVKYIKGDIASPKTWGMREIDILFLHLFQSHTLHHNRYTT